LDNFLDSLGGSLLVLVLVLVLLVLLLLVDDAL
jgi:hypothetical protein